LLQVILIDDERCVLEELAYRLEGKVKIVGKFTSSLTALERVESLKPDAVFLDIEMPGLNGLETAAEILTLLPETAIIFVTAYSHHAVKAFELNAIDYLVKPVQIERLDKTLDRLTRYLHSGEKTPAGNQLKNLLQTSLVSKLPEKIILWKDKNLEVKAVNSIAGCFVAKGERLVRVIAEGNIYHTQGSLNDFISKIGTDLLLRCHRSYYLNPRRLIRLEREGGKTMCAYLEGYQEPIPVSRAYRQTLLKSLINSGELKEIGSL
jgi:DNA-binding LytR/AlgR family response regulator